VTDLLEGFEFGLAKKRVEELFWNDLCDHWLEMAKDRFYDASPEGAPARRAAQAAAYDVFFGILRLLAPFVPHVVEAIHQAHFRDRERVASITRAAWPSSTGPTRTTPARGASTPRSCLAAVRRWRSEHKVSPAKAIPRIRLTLPPSAFARFAEVEADVRSAGRVGAIETAEGPAGSDAATIEILEPPAA
jgi:valyl-tRNA synthetase